MTATEARLRRLGVLVGVPLVAAASLSVGHPIQSLAAASSSSQVGYLTDTSTGGNSIWTGAFGISNVADGGSYSTVTPAPSATVTIHNVSMTALDSPNSTALSALDTLVVFNVCDIGTKTNALIAINAFFTAGHKVIFLDGAWCTSGNGGDTNWSTFTFPFNNKYAQFIPQNQASGGYSSVEASTLTTGLPDCTPTPCNEPGNVLADGLTLNTTATQWCTALVGESNDGGLSGASPATVTGPMLAYARSSATAPQGLAIYSGEPYSYSSGTAATQKHLRLVFDDAIAQAWNPDGLPCAANGTPPPVAELHAAVAAPAIGLVLMAGLLVTMVARRRRRTAAL